jgi:hypothetical protein
MTGFHPSWPRRQPSETTDMRATLRSHLCRASLALVAVFTAACSPKPPLEVTGARIDSTFPVEGARGLVVSVQVNDLQGPPTSEDFRLVFADSSLPPGSLAAGLAPFAMGFPAAANPPQRWTILADRVVTIEKKGPFEFVFLIGPGVRQAALHFRQQAVGTVAVPQ